MYKPTRLAFVLATLWLTACSGANHTTNGCVPTINLACLQQGSDNMLFDLGTILGCLSVHEDTQTLRVLAPTGYHEQLRASSSALQASEGWLLDIQAQDADSFGDMLRSNLTALSQYDVWIVDPAWTVELVGTGLVQSLNGFDSQDMEWSDVYGVFSNFSSMYDTSLSSIPLGGEVTSMYLRSDLLNGTQPPATWDELLAVAQQLNGTDLNNDGQPDYALCLPLAARCEEGGLLLSQILASMTQTLGTQSGWLFLPENMKSLVYNRAMNVALSLLSSLAQYSWPAASDIKQQVCGAQWTSSYFLAGRCAVTFGGFELFKLLQLGSSQAGPVNGSGVGGGVWAGVGQAGWYQAAELPGSSQVLDRTTGLLVDCGTTTACPYAQNTSSALTTGLQLVNRAPSASGSGLAAFINQRTSKEKQQAAFNLLVALSSTDISLVRMLKTQALPGLGPYRQSQLARGLSDSRGLWNSAGLGSAAQLGPLIGAMNRSLTSGNAALWVRMAGQDMVREAMQQAASMQLSGSARGETVRYIRSALLTLTGSPVSAQMLQGYQAGLQWRPPPPEPPSPKGPASPPMPSAEEESSSGSGYVVLIIVIAVLGIAGPLACAFCFWCTRKRTKRVLGKLAPPKCTPTSTILVTDIENSTLLWESVSQHVMNQSVEMHHALIRTLLGRHSGYESATEGDSFIVAFHTPANALKFAESFQLELLQLDWPDELLASPLAGCLSAKASRAPTNFVEGVAARGPKSQFIRGSSSTNLSESIVGSMMSKIFLKTSKDRYPRASDRNGSIVPQPENGAADPPPRLRIQSFMDSNPTSPSGKDCEANTNSGDILNGISFDLALPPRFDWDSRREGEAAGSLSGKLNLVPYESAPLVPNIPVFTNFMRRSLTEGHQSSPPRTVLEFIRSQWMAVPTPNSRLKQKSVRLVFRGLRVRVGMHTGISLAEDAVLNKTTGRVQYGGQPLGLAKAVADCGHGGQVLMTQSTFEELPSDLLSKESVGMIMNMGDVQFAKNPGLPPTSVYQMVVDGLEQRLAFLKPRMRDVSILQASVLDAPLGDVAVVFANAVGMSTLMAWNRELAQEALLKCEIVAADLIQRITATPNDSSDGANNAYIMEMASGLCLAAFTSPASAVMWGLQLIDQLKSENWPEELLEHELCEEVVVALQRGESDFNANMRSSVLSAPMNRRGSAVFDSSIDQQNSQEFSSTLSQRNNRPSSAHVQVLFRGPRFKVGIDMGPVHAKINPTSGRMAYRGRVMNRSARIAEKAGSGQVWCSDKAWSAALGMSALELHLQSVDAQLLGGFNLKGVNEEVQLVQCSMATPSKHPLACGSTARQSRDHAAVIHVRHREHTRLSSNFVPTEEGSEGSPSFPLSRSERAGWEEIQQEPASSLSTGRGECEPRACPWPGQEESPEAVKPRAGPAMLPEEEAYLFSPPLPDQARPCELSVSQLPHSVSLRGIQSHKSGHAVFSETRQSRLSSDAVMDSPPRSAIYHVGVSKPQATPETSRPAKAGQTHWAGAGSRGRRRQSMFASTCSVDFADRLSPRSTNRGLHGPPTKQSSQRVPPTRDLSRTSGASSTWLRLQDVFRSRSVEVKLGMRKSLDVTADLCSDGEPEDASATFNGSRL